MNTSKFENDFYLAGFSKNCSTNDICSNDLHDFEKAYILKSKSKTYQAEQLASLILLKKHLNFIDVNDDHLIQHYSNGKPYMVSQKYDVSLAHKTNISAFGISKDARFNIGVDIEQTTKKIDNDFVKNYVLNDSELQSNLLDQIQTKYNKCESDAGYTIWCIKEAFFKSLSSRKFNPKDYVVTLSAGIFQCNNLGNINIKSDIIEIFYSDDIVFVLVLTQLKETL